MGTETRIGIVTGLLIVVVASVYFFYGNDRTKDDLMLSNGAGAAAPPKIPDVRRPSDGASRGKAAKSPRAAPAQDRVAHTSASPTRRAMPQDRRRGTFPSAKPSTTLGAAASPTLVEATQKNLTATPPERRPVRHGADLSAIGRQIGRHRDAPAAKTSKLAPQTRTGRSSPSAVRGDWPKRHVIAAGDTLSAIAARYYGSTDFIAAIAGANPHLKDARHLRIGDKITLPAPGSSPGAAVQGQAAAGRNDAASAVARTHHVREGESFYSIARKRLGSGRRWEELYRLNKDVVKNDPKNLRSGMVLRLPG